MQQCQLIEQRGGDGEDIIVVGAREAAARRDQVLEHHDELCLCLVERRMPDPRDAHREFVANGRIEASLRHAEAGGPEELPLFG